MLKHIKLLLKNNRSLLLFILLMCIFRSAVADWNHVPSGSMKPTILEGDRLVVNKMAYDLHIPFTHMSLLSFADPQRGDIIIFDSAAADKRLVKRVIGEPGDTVAMRDNQLIINNQPLDYTIQKQTNHYQDSQELLGQHHYQVRQRYSATKRANFGPVTVPADHFLVLGDNRDASADSRVIGFVPRNEITGRAHTIAFSNDLDNYYLFRPERFLKPI
ncbi:signal peptidase I [Shewanella waksmanii]|uniref:signal peptidase I n=1 Tax=Shewanella waksmanii TaxID=213783 RepID=UPI00048F0CE6|nr:signal peptidase I [Shewanella waksmanii]